MLVPWDRKCNGVLGGDLLFWNSPQLRRAECVSRSPLCLLLGWCWGGADPEGSGIATAPASCAFTKTGRESSFSNRDEMHNRISPRLESSTAASLKERVWRQKCKETRGYSILGCLALRLVTLWMDTPPEFGWLCLLAFPKECRAWKGFQTSPYPRRLPLTLSCSCFA